MGIAAQPARAQLVTVTGSVNPNEVPPAHWQVGGGLAVGFQGNGTLRIENGGKVTNADGYLGYRITGSGPSNGTATVSGPLSEWNNSGWLAVGYNRQGDLIVENGGKVFSSEASIGELGTAIGVVTLSGQGSSWTNTNALDVGYRGNGTLNILNEATVSSARGLLGWEATAVATVSVTGAGSTWTIADDLQIANRGRATLTVDSSGTVTADSMRLALLNGTATLDLLGSDAGGRGVVEAGYVEKVRAGGTLNFDGGILRARRDESDFLRNFGALTAGAQGAWFDSNGYDVTIGPGTTFAGSSSLDKIGAGTLTLTGDSSGFGGTTTVSGGALIVGTAAGGALGGVINVDNGGLLGGIGTIGTAGSAVTIAAGGIHAPGNSIGVQHVAGDYVNHGTLRIEATPTDADRIVVAGAVDIAGATLDLALSPVDAASWDIFNGPLTIIENGSAGAVVGTFADPASGGLVFLDAVLDYRGGDGNDVTLALNRNDITFASIGRTRNQIATGAGVESLGNTDPLWASIALTTDEDVVRAGFDALSGEIHASMKAALIEDSRFVRNAVNDRVRAAFDGVGASHAPVLAYGPGEMSLPVSPGHAGPAFWLAGFGSWGKTDGDGNAAGLDRSTGGVLVGADGPVGDWRLGLAAGYSHSRVDAKDRASSGRSDNYHFGVYGGREWGSLALRAGAAYTWHDIDTTRTVAVPGIGQSLSAGYDAGTFQAFAEMGYGIDRGATRFEPFASLAHVSLHGGGFAERGGGAALSGAGNADVTFTTLGLRAEHHFTLGAVNATLRGMAGWRHAFGDTVATGTHAFAAGNGFTVAGAPIAADSAVIEAGLDLDLGPQATLGISYTGQFAAGARDHGFRTSLTVRF